MAEKIRIKDIAERAGVSAGTVDRVLHGRPNVSPDARKKVEQALREMDYHPNMYASALAFNKAYHFIVLMPSYESEAYWEEVEEGILKAAEEMADFQVKIHILYYDRYIANSFVKQCQLCIDSNPDGMVIVPSVFEATQAFTTQLHDHNIPFVLLDSNIPELQPLAFYGQDSFCSGYFAAKMMRLFAGDEKWVMIMRLIRHGKVLSKQQENREVGFRHYMAKHCPHTSIVELDLPLGCRQQDYEQLLDEFFAVHPDLHHCITFNSKAYIIGEYLLDRKRKDVHIMGYDMVNRNAICLREGSITFLIAQHAFMQGHSCIDTLFNAVVLKKQVTPVNYMPIELITRENMDFYRRTSY